MGSTIRLRTLGSLQLQGAEGNELRSVLAQPRRVALLVYLALASPRSLHRRDKLLALFWPEQDEPHARNALSQAVHFLRRTLGAEAVLSRADDEVGLNREIVSCDAVAFETALDAGKTADALELYRGPLLEGFHVSAAAPEFDRWLDEERARLARRYADAVAAAADAREAAGDFASAVTWLRRLAAHDPFSSRVTLRLMRALAAAGDPAAAIQHARVHETLLREELQAPPDPQVAALVRELQSRGRGERVQPTPALDRGRIDSTPPPASPPPDPEPAQRRGKGLLHHLEAMATPSGGVTPTGATLAARPSRRDLRNWGHWLAYVGVAALGLVAAFGVFAHFHARSETSRASVRSTLVVLPFENLGRPEDEYFADGMTEEVTARLVTLHELGVIGRTSASEYKRTTKTIPQIGQELGVDYILEGTVRWEKSPRGPSRVRITPQLIRVSDASHVWAKVYDAVLADVFDVQANIATQVAASIDVALLAPEREALAAKPTTNLEAYDYYLRGKDYDAGQYVVENAHLAVLMYRRAVQLDPTFALAWAALARAHLFLSWVFGQTGELPKAQAALEHAERLGPELPETRLALGYYYYYGDRDYDRALEQFVRVRGRQPNNPDVMSAIGYIHRRQGRLAEAVGDMSRATELDPRNHGVFFSLGQTYGFLLRRYPEAERALARANSLAPDVPRYYSLRAYLYLTGDGNAGKARRLLREVAGTLDPGRILFNGSPSSTSTTTSLLLVRVFPADFTEALTQFPLRAAGWDTAGYYLTKAEYYRATSDAPRARAYFDSARVSLETKVAVPPATKAAVQWPVEMLLALADAGLGRKADAIRLARQTARQLPVSGDALVGPDMLVTLAEIYMRTGEYDAALDQLEYLVSIPSPVSTGLLRVDPLYAPLRGNPRFERLVRGKS